MSLPPRLWGLTLPDVSGYHDLLILLGVSLALGVYLAVTRRQFRAPYIGHRAWYDPTSLVRLRSIWSLRSMIEEGYSKHREEPFIVRTIDNDILLMPNRYLEEMRLLPENKASGSLASGDMLSRKYTEFAPMLESDQHMRVIQNHLTPNLSTFFTRAESVIDDFFQQDPRLPNTDGEGSPHASINPVALRADAEAEWREVSLHDVLERVVSEMTTMIFLGEEFTKNEAWIKLCSEYPRNMFGTGMLLRLFPTPLKYLVSRAIPARFSVKRQIQEAQRILVPVIEKIRKKEDPDPSLKSDDGPIDVDDPSTSTLLEWMVHNARGEAETNPKKLASRQLILTLASIHTSVMAVFYALFDLLQYPEYVEPLREEILALAQDDGKDGKVKFAGRDLSLLAKMDSFLAESQRFHPPIMVSPQRKVLQTLTLKDGIVLPAGLRIGFPSIAIHFDPSVNPDPTTFDGYRLYHKQTKLVQVHKDHLLFGYGRKTCPGRFWAVGEIKMILAKILIGFDFRAVQEGWGCRTYYVNEMAFPDPRTTLLMRARKAL